jgi:hypothetical protein
MRLVTLWPSAHPAPSSDAVAVLAHHCRSSRDVSSQSNARFYVPRPAGPVQDIHAGSEAPQSATAASGRHAT